MDIKPTLRPIPVNLPATMVSLALILATSPAGAIEIPVVWSTYFGGPGHDEGVAVEIGSDGAVYVGGSTNRSDLLPPAETDLTLGDLGGWDAVILKISADGSTLLWKAVIGGPGLDVLFELDVDDRGVVTACGRASPGFPTTAGPAHGGVEDAFVVQVDTTTGAGEDPLLYGRFLGGVGEDAAVSVSVDSRARIQLAGYTASWDFPVVPGGLLDTYQGGEFDFFLSVVDPSTDEFVYSTFLGTAGNDVRTGADNGPVPETARYVQIQMTSFRDTLVLCTHSMSPGLPTTDDAYQLFHSGSNETYIAQIDADPALDAEEQLVYATYLGTSGWDAPEGGIAVDDDGVFYVLGYSWDSSFPLTEFPFDDTHQGGREGTLSVIDPSQWDSESRGLIYSTFLGGSGNEYNGALTLLPGRKLLVAGYSDSRDFPANLGTYGGGASDTPIMLFDFDHATDSPDFGSVLCSRFYGGGGEEDVRDLAATDDGGVVAVGFSSSSGLGTLGSFQAARSGGADILITKFAIDESTPSLLFSRADPNDDGTADLSDAVFTLNWLFLGGETPDCLAAANANADDAVNVTDPTYLLNHLFLGGPPPPAPFPECGTSELAVDEALGCEASSCP